MSCIVTVAAVGTVLVNTGILSGIATGVAAGLGLRTLERAAQADAQAGARQAAQEEALAAGSADVVEISSASAEALSKVVAERCRLVFGDEKMTLTVDRDIRGKLTVRAHGEGVSEGELHRRADALLKGIQQQVAYREAVALLKGRGFKIEHEERLPDGTARVRVVKAGG